MRKPLLESQRNPKAAPAGKCLGVLSTWLGRDPSNSGERRSGNPGPMAL